MAQPSLPYDTKYEIERLWAAVREMNRKRDRRPPNVRDLQDVNGWGAATGYALMYDQTTGRYKPVIAPPTLRFNKNGALTVSSSDHDPMGGPGKLIKVKARLKTSGSSTTTAVLKEGATTVATFSFTSGNVLPTTTPTVAYSYDEDDYFWLDVTAAGTGAAGLVVEGWATAA